MKVIESQAAVLSNYEVHQHLADQRARYKQLKHRGPANLETVVKEALEFLERKPSPLSQKPITYTTESIAQLLERLRPFDLSKGEVVIMLNVRPASVVVLNTILEDMGERFTEEQQYEILTAISDVLGGFPVTAEEEGQEEADVAMDDAAAS